MTAHDSFWLVAGTAGPVLALANVAALLPAAGSARTLRGPQKFADMLKLPRWRRIWAYVNPKETNIGDVSYLLAMVGFGVNFLVTAAALHTLGSAEYRGGHTRWIESLLDLAFGLLLVQVGTAILAIRQAEQTRHAIPAAAPS